jgi:hypothetical protein
LLADVPAALPLAQVYEASFYSLPVALKLFEPVDIIGADHSEPMNNMRHEACALHAAEELQACMSCVLCALCCSAPWHAC